MRRHCCLTTPKLITQGAINRKFQNTGNQSTNALRLVFGYCVLCFATSRSVWCAQVWARPVSLAATKGIPIGFFSSGYWDVSLPQVYSPTSSVEVTDINQPGSPIRKSPGITVASHLTGAYRRQATSFIAFFSLGIHHTLLDLLLGNLKTAYVNSLSLHQWVHIPLHYNARSATKKLIFLFYLRIFHTINRVKNPYDVVNDRAIPCKCVIKKTARKRWKSVTGKTRANASAVVIDLIRYP